MLEISPGQDIELDPASKIQNWLKAFPADVPVVAIPVFNAYEDVLECLESILASRQPNIPVLLIDDASTDSRIKTTFEALSYKGEFFYVRKPKNSGFVGSVNLAFEACAPHDVVVVNSDLVLPPGWLERLKEAAYSRSTIATATPFTNYGTILSLPHRNKPVPGLIKGMTVAQMDERVRRASLKLRPVIPTAIGHCTYFKRFALDIVGFFDEAFAPGYGEEVDLSQRAVTMGLCHVVADDVFVYHKGSRSFGQSEAKQKIQEEHERMLNLRYPWYQKWVTEASHAPRSPLAITIEVARAALLDYQIAIDATSISEGTTGTQVVTLELIRALATAPNRGGKITVVLADHVPAKALLGVEKLVDEIIPVSHIRNLKHPRFDLIYRPFQVYHEEDLVTLQKAATRFVLSHLDSIAFSNPSYFPRFEEWEEMRYISQLTFAAADGVTFISRDAAQDALSQGLNLPPERTCVSYVGVDHHIHQADLKAPPAAVEFADKPFLLVMGTNFKHKNRAHTLRVFKALVEKYNWTGHLVLAGPGVSVGGSGGEESLEILQNPALRSRLHYLGAVDEGEKYWLLKKAALVFYPSLYEGFGIVPFEAAQGGTPAITGRTTSLNEVLGDKVVYLDNFEPGASADTLWSLLNNPQVAQRQVEAINERAKLFTWDKVGETTWDFLKKTVSSPPRLQQVITKEGLEEKIADIYKEYTKLENWADGLNKQVLEIQQKPIYKWLARFRLL